MAGGKIAHSDAVRIVERTGIHEIHVGLSSPVASPMLYRNPRVSMGKAHGREYQRMLVLEEDVRRLQRAVSLGKT
jgi:copper homeostasis protein CutC